MESGTVFVKENGQQTLDRLIMSLIGGLNGRYPFFKYLKRKAEGIIAQGGIEDEVVRFVKSEHRFWSALLRKELRKYEAMRDEATGVKWSYAFVHFEFDDLFRYYEDPAAAFGIDINRQLSEEEHKELIGSFQKAIEQKRGYPWTFIPTSLASYLFMFYRVLFVHAFEFICYLIGGRYLMGPEDKQVLKWAKPAPTPEAERALTFWKISFVLGLGLNIMLAVSLYRLSVSTHLPAVNIIFFCVLQLFFFPISLRAITHLLRTIVAFRYSRRNMVAPIKTWSHVRKYFNTVRNECDYYQKDNLDLMLRELRRDNLLTESEFRRFLNGDASRMPLNATACYRIRRWMNKHYHLKIVDPSGPILWDELESFTILIFSLDEKFFYSFHELIQGLHGDRSILEQLRISYNDEWENLISELRIFLSDEQVRILRKDDFRRGSFPEEAAGSIERWANMRIQSIYNTLESIRPIYDIYGRIARRRFPEACEDYIRGLVREKIQIIFLHDRYPQYRPGDKQKADIDKYLSENPEVEIQWPRDLLSRSKYGAFTNVLSYIRGDFLLTFDSDHNAAAEEVAYIPYLFRIFKRQPRCEAVGFRMYSYNENYNSLAHMMSLSSNAWWVHDLRVQCLVGGGGVYGKMLIRTKALFEREFVQPDSVGEDMLAMSRLTASGAQIQFSELVEMGQGEETTYYGLKRKFGRYPTSALESQAVKLYREMLLSQVVPLYRKLEFFFMLSYYPVQTIIVLAHFTVLSAWAFGIDIFSHFSFLALFLSYSFITITDSLYVWVHMHEREGIIRGTKHYFSTFIPITLFHASYYLHYTEQVIRSLKGYAKFNISEKKYHMPLNRWTEHYINNKFSFKVASAGLCLFIFGVFFQRHSTDEMLKIAPFIFSNVIWGFSVLFFVRREEKILWRVDFLGEVLFIIVRSLYDTLLVPLKEMFVSIHDIYVNKRKKGGVLCEGRRL